MSAGDEVKIRRGVVPEDYTCDCRYCLRALGELRPDGDGYYSRLERREYYAPEERGDKGHVAKTPLQIARWAVQNYTKVGDWVLDPTMGAGTTAVEAITQGRNAVGMELQFGNILRKNVELALSRHPGTDCKIRVGDARTIGTYLSTAVPEIRFQLVVNNPPYSGDEHMSTMKSAVAGTRHMSGTFKYESGLPNLAFLKEGREYWDELGRIYAACIARLEAGGHFVVGVKDMMRKKQPFYLHREICDLLGSLGLNFVGTAFLKHMPKTQFLNTYHKMPYSRGVHPPYYQTISVFKKAEQQKEETSGQQT